MIKVYFETSSYAEHVATLDSEPASEAFWDAMLLVAQAKGFDKVTESIMASRGDYCIALATLGSTNICGLSIDEHSNADHDFNSAVLDRQIHDKNVNILNA